jgi:hypothetical protein
MNGTVDNSQVTGCDEAHLLVELVKLVKPKEVKMLGLIDSWLF